MTIIIAILEGVEAALLPDMARKHHLSYLRPNLGAGDHWAVDGGPVPYEPTNLATAFSGVGPGQHGCFSYWSCRDEGKPRILESRDVKAPRLWQWPEMKGLKFGLVNLQLTHPPQPVEGFMLSYLMNQSLRYSYPADLIHRLKGENIPYGHDVSAFYRGEGRDDFGRKVRAIADYQLATACHLVPEVDILIINMTLADRVSHFFWHELALENQGCPSLVEEAYLFMDKALARLDHLAGDDPLLVFSEMGFGALDEFISFDKILQKNGLQSPDLYMPDDQTSTVAREAVQGSHGIILSPEAGPNAKAEVIDCLRAARDGQGQPLVKTIWNAHDLYEGPYAHLAPDLIIDPADPGRPPMGDPRWADHVIRQNQSGWHRDRGFAFAHRAVPTVGFNQTVQLESIAPTIAALAGRESPDFCHHAPFLTKIL